MKLLTEQIISVGSALGIVLLFIFVVHLPQKYRLSELQDQIQAQEEQLSLAKQKTSVLVPLNKRVETLRAAVAKFDKRLLGRNELGAYLEEVVAKLKSAQLISEEIRPQSPITMPRYSELPITIKFRGSFQNIYAFLDNIEKITHLTQVRELKLQRNRKGDPEIRATMVLNIYCHRS